MPYVNIAQGRSQKQAGVKRAGQPEASTEFIPSPFPEQREPVIIEGRSTRKASEATPPVINKVVKTKPKKNPRPEPPPAQTKPSEQAAEKTNKPAKTSSPQTHKRQSSAPLPEARIDAEASKPANTETIPPAPPQRPRLSKRNVWKPGHGAIEKVNKLTGEIVHLVEEYIDNKEI